MSNPLVQKFSKNVDVEGGQIDFKVAERHFLENFISVAYDPYLTCFFIYSVVELGLLEYLRKSNRGSLWLTAVKTWLRLENIV